MLISRYADLNHEMNRQRLVLAKGVAGFSEMVEAMLRVSEQVTMEAASGARVNAIHSAFEDGMTSVKVSGVSCLEGAGRLC